MQCAGGRRKWERRAWGAAACAVRRRSEQTGSQQAESRFFGALVLAPFAPRASGDAIYSLYNCDTRAPEGSARPTHAHGSRVPVGSQEFHRLQPAPAQDPLAPTQAWTCLSDAPNSSAVLLDCNLGTAQLQTAWGQHGSPAQSHSSV